VTFTASGASASNRDGAARNWDDERGEEKERERERENTSGLRYSRNTGSLNPGKEP